MLTANQNYYLLQEIEANRLFILMAYQQNPELLASAEARIQQIVGMVASHGRDNHLSSVLSPRSSERGISLIELVMFIVIISVALAGILTVMNKVTGHSADTLIRKQSLAIAESLLEEVELMPFTYCDPIDPLLATADPNNVLGAGAIPCTAGLSQDALGPVPAGETRYSGANPFDNVGDYAGFNPPDIRDINNNLVGPASGYTATVGIVAAGGAFLASAFNGDALRITVTVTGPDGIPVVLDGYRARYAPNEGP